MTSRILVGDCLSVLPTLEAGAAHTCVTSPPYWGLRDYGVSGQLGLERTPEEYVAKIVAVFREVRRVLRDDGTVFLNLGDSYFGGGRGGGGSYGPERRAWHAVPCGTSGKAPEGSQESDCLCGSLCGACRAAYRIGKSHNGGLPAPTPVALPSASSPAHTESASGHPPTSDSPLQVDHTEGATRGLARVEAHADAPPHASRVSTHERSDAQRRGDSLLSDTPLACRLCGCSLGDGDPEIGHRSACTSDTDSRLDALCPCMTGRLSSVSAYPKLTNASLKSKDLVGIPWRVAFALQADGWYLRSDIIWSKPNPMPESVTDRPTKAHEYLFLLSKSERYYYDAASVAEPVTETTVARLSQPTLGQQAGSDRVPGKTNGRMKAVPPRFGGSKYGDNDAPEHRTKSGNVYDIGNGTRNRRTVWDVESTGNRERECIAILKSDLNTADKWDAIKAMMSGAQSDVWRVTTQPFSGAHFATFPPKLIEPCILAGCPKDGVVLDPFGGAGTTGLVADRLGRNTVLIELNPAYAEMARNRITDDAPLFAEGA